MSVPELNGNQPGGVKFLFRALRHRNYRLFFLGQGVSVIGTWMQGTALGWLIIELANSSMQAQFWSGLVPLGQLPTAILPLLTGALADRHSRQRILLITQVLSMLQAIALFFLVVTGRAELWHLLLLSLVMGLINSFDVPARQSFTVDMLEDRRDLGNAIALNSSLVNGARLIGPLIAGGIIAVLDTATCFLINALSYLAVIGALLAMRVPASPIRRDGHVLEGIREGFKYAIAWPPIRTILMLIAMASFIGVSYGVLVPVLAKYVLGGEAHVLGLLLGASGAGALCGVLFLASRPSIHGIKTIIAASAGCFGIGLILLSFSHVLWLSMLTLLLTGFGMTLTMSASNTFLQAVVDDDKRGRVMSLWTIAFMGMVPFGSLCTGSMSHYFSSISANPNDGILLTLRAEGSIVLLCAALFATRLPMLRRLTHPIYIRKGLLPQVAMSAASMPSAMPEAPPAMANPATGNPTNARFSPDTAAPAGDVESRQPPTCQDMK